MSEIREITEDFQDWIDLMKAEEVALLAADFSEISIIHAKKIEFLRAMRRGNLNLDQENLSKLKKVFETNSTLILASQKGLRSAQEKIQEIMNATSSMRVYSCRGSFVPSQTNGVEQKY